jgi:serine protease Do
MNRLGALSLMFVLGLSGCHQSAKAPEADKVSSDSSSSNDDTPTEKPVAFNPKTGPLVSGEEIPLLEQINRESTKVVAAVMPGIVRISAVRQTDPRAKLFGKSLPFDFHFGPTVNRGAQLADPSYGAGIILRKDGYIVTNTHVLLVDDARELVVQLHDKRLFPARVIAYDSSLDLAVLKIDATNLMPLPWGDSDHVMVGEQVFAIGNPFNQDASVSRGVISAIGRSLPGSPGNEDYLQTDAAINPGNSGGPLINIHGEVIGINTLIASTSGGNEGVGFAIPSNMARNVVETLLKEGNSEHGYLGVQFPETIDDGVNNVFGLSSKHGALLAGVDPGTPADKAGLHPGDFITGMDGHKIGGVVDLRLVVAQVPIGKEVEVNYIRDGSPQSTRVTIAKAPQAAQNTNSSWDNPPTDNAASGENVLNGLQVNDLSDKIRQQYGVDASVTSGVVINSVEQSTPADLKGLAKGDVIESISVNHGTTRQLASAQDFADTANTLKSDQGVVLLVRHGKTSSFIYLAPVK